MKYLITMNMPVRGKDREAPQQIHQIIADHPATDLRQFAEVLNDNAFIAVEEFYKGGEDGYYHTGTLILNTDMIGKVKLPHTNSNNGDKR